MSDSIVICSLFEGTKARVVRLEDRYRPLKVLMTDGWGFILTYAVLEVV
jgi:hypothetical protein